MKIPLSWLQEYYQYSGSVTDLNRRLTDIGHMLDKPAYEIEGDTVLDLEIRQNRSDCLSVVGIAREVAATEGKRYEFEQKGLTPDNSKEHSLKIVSTSKDCIRFKAYKITGLNTQAETPTYIQRRLTAYGIKLINVVVDITNYVMVELGEPLHAFDARSFPDDKILIRPAKKDERMTILGGRDIALSPQDLLIASDDEAVSIAGMIGGEKSGVSSDTTDIILEAATYNHATIRRSSLRHELRTEVSTRHEKILHPDLAASALDRCAQLIIEHCGGQIVGVADHYPEPVRLTKIAFDPRLIERLGGIKVEERTSLQHLANLNFVVEPNGAMWDVTVPYYRTDIVYAADLVEEVLRMVGYHTLPDTMPASAPPRIIQSKHFDYQSILADELVKMGFDEQITEPLVDETQASNSGHVAGGSDLTPIKLQNSLNADKSHLRTSLYYGLDAAYENNLKHGLKTIKLFEIGKIYYVENAEYKECWALGMICAGSEAYFELKGVFEKLGLTNFNFYAFASGAVYGQVTIQEIQPLKQDALLTAIPQETSFDISFTVDNTQGVGDIIATLYTQLADVKTVILGEMPRPLPDSKKSILLRITVANDKVQNVSENITTFLQKTYHASIR